MCWNGATRWAGGDDAETKTCGSFSSGSSLLFSRAIGADATEMLAWMAWAKEELEWSKHKTISFVEIDGGLDFLVVKAEKSGRKRWGPRGCRAINLGRQNGSSFLDGWMDGYLFFFAPLLMACEFPCLFREIECLCVWIVKVTRVEGQDVGPGPKVSVVYTSESVERKR